MSVNFMAQAIRILHTGEYDNLAVDTMYNFAINVDKNTIISYYNTNTALSYKNDLELYVEILDILIKIYEEQEEYEKCTELMAKKHESLAIMKKKTNDYVQINR